VTARPAHVVALRPRHADGVLAVYADGIATRQATFETSLPTWTQWDQARLPGHRYVAVTGRAPDDDGGPPAGDDRGSDAVVPAQAPMTVLGWVAVSAASTRGAYAGVVEVGVYVAAAARGRGVGATLLRRLVESCDADGIWTVQAGIFPENRASLALHEGLGFRRVGVRERIGRLDGRWRDVVLLERRSTVAGV
jgi:L-amino acid N-acyltransferase YncA